MPVGMVQWPILCTSWRIPHRMRASAPDQRHDRGLKCASPACVAPTALVCSVCSCPTQWWLMPT
eukprot:2389807-Alexandrium_andersonii.AAC.1